MNRVIKIIVSILIIIEISFMYLTYKSFTNKPSNINEVAVKSIEGISPINNGFAIMLENVNGGFTASADKTQWPDPNTYIYFGSSCYDGSGKPVETNVTFDTTSKKFTMKTKTSSYCYISFARKTSSLGKIIQNAGDQIETMSNMQAREDTLRRFQGTNEEVLNNYICLGTSKKEDCTSNTKNYMYRIMGIVTEDDSETLEKTGQLKIIKKDTDIKLLWTLGVWDAPCYPNRNLNGSSYLTESDYNLSSTIGSTTKTWVGNAIVDHKWHYSYSFSNSETKGMDATEVFEVEKKSWDSDNSGITEPTKIALMYLSDYLLAIDDGSLCASGMLAGTYDSCSHGWIHGAGYEENEYFMTSTPTELNGTYFVWSVEYNGYVGNRSGNYSAITRPVFYLSEKTKITSGIGTIEDPYIITDVG